MIAQKYSLYIKEKKMDGSNHISSLVNLIASEYKAIGDEAGLDKFRRVKSAILKSLAAARENDRFPAIRALSDVLGVAPVPIQKAVAELIAENYLYSKSRVGLFVKTPTEKVAMNTTIDQKNNIVMFFDEKSEMIHNMMFPVLDILRQKLDWLEIALFFSLSSSSKFDLYIQSPLPSGTIPLNLKETAAHELRRGNLVLADDFTAPLANQTYYFVWNKNMLKKKNFQEPSYTTFADQKKYFASLSRHFELPVLSWLRPDFLLGKEVSFIVETLKKGHSSDSEDGRTTISFINEILDLCMFWEYEKDAAPVNSFLQGKRIGMVVQTTSITAMEPEIKDFELGYYPILTHDNALVLLPTPMRLPAKRDIFYDGLKIIMAMQSDAIQQHFFERKYITAQREGKYLPESLRDAAKNAVSILLGDDTDNYLRHKIIRYEMLMTAIYGGDRKTAIENIFEYCGSVIKNFSEDEGH